MDDGVCTGTRAWEYPAWLESRLILDMTTEFFRDVSWSSSVNV